MDYSLFVSEKITLVDWESLLWGPEVMDCAVLFDRNPELTDTFSGPEHRRQWIETYLSTRPVDEAVQPSSFEKTESFRQRATPNQKTGRQDIAPSLETALSGTKIIPPPQKIAPSQAMDLWYKGSLKASLISTFTIVVLKLDLAKGSLLKADLVGMAIHFYKKFKEYSQELEALEKN